MMDYERGLGDLGFRGTKDRELGRRLGEGESPSQRLRFSLGRRRLQEGPAARARVLVGQGVGLEGHPCPSLYRWEGAAKGEGVLPQLGLLGWRWRERNSFPSRFPTLPPPSKLAV